MGDVLGKILKWFVYTGAAGIMLLALLVGIARLLLPLVPEYQDDIRRWAAQATGFDVQFETISASWPFAGPELQFIDVTVSSQETGEPIFYAENLTVGISLFMLIRDRKALLNRIGVQGSKIRLRRDGDGNILFQGRLLEELIRFESDPDNELRLPELSIELSAIDVSFTDNSRSAVAYSFGIEQLDIGLSTEQIVIDGQIELAPEFGSRVTITTDLPLQLLRSAPAAPNETGNRRSTSRSAHEWRIFIDGEDLQFAKILTYALNRDVPFIEGHGDVTVSAAFAGRRPQSITTDFAIADVTLHIDASRTQRHEGLSGRLEWERDKGGGWLLAGTDISARGRDLFTPRSDFAIAVQPARPGRIRSIKASAGFLRLQDLYPLVQIADNEGMLAMILSADQQLPRAVRGDVHNLNFNLYGATDAPAIFSVTVEFADIGVVGWGDGISMRGISGGLVADQDGGRLQIDGRITEVALPALFMAPVGIQSVTGLLVWRVGKDIIHVLSDNVRVRLPFFEADTRFELDWPRNGDSPLLDLTATAVASDVRRIVPLLPLKKFPPRTAGWLQRAIIAGRISRADIRFSGPLREFPFAAGEGEFSIDIDFEDTVLDYAKHWPRIDALDARIVFDGLSLTSRRNSGRIGGIGFRDSVVQIADLREGRLEISARQTVGVDTILGFLRQSPVAGAIGPVIDKATGGGTVNTDLQLVVPIKHPADYELGIVIDAHGADLGMTGLDWGFTGLDGTLTVRNTRFYADGMTATLLDEPVTLDLHPAADSSDLYGQFIRIAGRTPVERWMQTLSLPFVNRVDGPANWNALVMIPQRQPDIPSTVHIIVRSDLVGVESRLPDPLAKTSGEARALQLDIAFPAEGRLEIGGNLHHELNWAIELESVDETWQIARGAVRAGSAAAIVAPGRGVELSGHLDFVRFDDWLTLTGDDTDDDGSGSADWQETWHKADLDIDRLSAFGLLFRDVRLEAHQDGQNWQVAMESPALAGLIAVPLDLDSGRPIEVAMDRLWLVESEAEDGAGDEPADPREIPLVEVKADDFVINKMHFGSLSTTIRQVTGGVLVEPVNIQGPTFTIEGDGAWLVHPNDESLRQSHLALNLTGTDIKAVLTALDYDPVVDGESIVASADLTWLGGPSEDFLHRADGKFRIRMDKGSVLAVSPGSGRILGILSLAALPRRLSFDFSDVFDKGLGFDTLKGDFTVDDGHAYTCNFGLEGSVADMGIVGRTGLAANDYDQLAVVRPHVSNLLAVGGTVVGGPVVGAAMLLFSQIFHKPLSTLGESYYRVTGSWDDPVVEQIHGSELDVTPLRNCEAYLADAITESLKE